MKVITSKQKFETFRQSYVTIETRIMILKLFILVTCINYFVLTTYIPDNHQIERHVYRIKRNIPKKIDENPKNHTRKTTNYLAESVPTTFETGLRAKRQDNDPNFLSTDYTISTALDEDNGVDLPTVMATTTKQTTPKPPQPKPTVKQQVI